MESLDFTLPAASQPTHSQISQSPIYDPAAATAFFEAAGVAENVAPGKTFFIERQQRGFFSADDRMYLLLAGAVVLSVGGKSIDTVKPGEIFGEMATLTNSRRSATATAKTACRVMTLDGNQFQKAIQKTPGFVLMLMSIMIDRLRLTLARLTMMKTLPDSAASDGRRLFDDHTLDDIANELGNPVLLEYSAGQPIINAGEAGVFIESFKHRYTKRFGARLPVFIPEAVIMAVQPLQQEHNFHGYEAPIVQFQEATSCSPHSMGLAMPMVYSTVDLSKHIDIGIRWEGKFCIVRGGTVNALRFITKNILAVILAQSTTIDWHNLYMTLPLTEPVYVNPEDLLKVSFQYRAGGSIPSLQSTIRVEVQTKRPMAPVAHLRLPNEKVEPRQAAFA